MLLKCELKDFHLPLIFHSGWQFRLRRISSMVLMSASKYASLSMRSLAISGQPSPEPVKIMAIRGMPQASYSGDTCVEPFPRTAKARCDRCSLRKANVYERSEMSSGYRFTYLRHSLTSRCNKSCDFAEIIISRGILKLAIPFDSGDLKSMVIGESMIASEVVISEFL